MYLTATTADDFEAGLAAEIAHAEGIAAGMVCTIVPLEDGRRGFVLGWEVTTDGVFVYGETVGDADTWEAPVDEVAPR